MRHRTCPAFTERMICFVLPLGCRRGNRAARRSPCPRPSSARPAARRPAPAPTTGTDTGPPRPAPPRPATSARRSTSYRLLDALAEGVPQPVLDQRDGQVGDVDADPAAFEPLRDGDSRPAAAEGIEHEVAFVAAGFDDPFQQGFGLLSGIAEALSCSRGFMPVNVVPQRPALVTRPASRRGQRSRLRKPPPWRVNQACFVPFIHCCICVRPVPAHPGTRSLPRFCRFLHRRHRQVRSARRSGTSIPSGTGNKRVRQLRIVFRERPSVRGMGNGSSLRRTGWMS